MVCGNVAMDGWMPMMIAEMRLVETRSQYIDEGER